MSSTRFQLLLLFFAFSSSLWLFSQEVDAQTTENQDSTVPGESAGADEQVENQTETEGTQNQAAENTQETSIETPELSRRSLATQKIIYHASYEQLFLLLQELNLNTRGSKSDMQTRLYNYYKLDPPRQPEKDNEGVEVVIDAAENVSVFRIEESDDEYIRLSGGVVLTLIDNANKQRHSIRADSLLLNKGSRYMTATGSVRYELYRENDNAPEVFRGETITINIDNWEGVFIDGISEKDQVIEGVSVNTIFSGETVVRSSSKGVAFSDVNITTGEEIDEGYFYVRVKKLWLLAEGEWAVLNPIVHVGNVPLLWFPFYFQPGDRLFFRPVLGIHSAFGPYVHTTTYIFGESSEDPEASLSLLQIESEDTSEREIDGLFLRPKKESEEDEAEKGIQAIAAERNWLLKFYLDGYARRGIFFGVEGVFNNLGSLKNEESGFVYAGINSITVSNYYAFTRTLFSPAANIYTNRIPFEGSLQDHWDRGYLFDKEIPFRFLVSLDTSITLFNLYVNAKLELFTDTTIGDEFSDRSESFSWDFALGRQKSLRSLTTRSRTNWSLKTSYNFDNLPFSGRAANVWDIVTTIASINLSNLELSFIQGAKNRPSEEIPEILNAASVVRGVEQKFYVPLQLDAPIIQTSISGSLFSYPFPSYYTSESDSNLVAQLYENPVTEDSLVRTPWDEAASQEGDQKETEFYLPPLKERDYTLTSFEPFSFDLSYAITPNFILTSITNADDWRGPSDIDFSHFFRYQSYSLSARVDLSYDLGILNSLFTHTGRITTNINDNGLLSTNTDLDSADRYTISENIFRKNVTTMQYTLNSSLYPFKRFPALSASNVSHSMSFLVYDNTYDSLAERNDLFYPMMKSRTLEWDDEFVTAHSLNANISIDVLGIRQSYSMGISLPPNEKIDISPSASLSVGPFSANTSIRITDVTNEAQYDPLNLNMSARFSFLESAHSISADQSFRFIVDDTDNTLDYSGTSLDLSLFEKVVVFKNSLYVQNTYRQKYSLQTNTWEEETDKSLIIESTRHSLRLNYSPEAFWKNRIELSTSLTSNLTMKYNRFIDSSFSFTLGVSVEIYQALSLSLSMNVQNSALHLYNKSYADMLGIDHRNFFTDLGDSLNIFDQTSLQRGQFKIQGVSFDITRSYRDWRLAFSYTGNPKILTENNTSKYIWENTFSFSVSWNLISQLRTKGTYEDETFTLVY